MDFLYKAFNGLISAGPYVMLPVIITVIGLVLE